MSKELNTNDSTESEEERLSSVRICAGYKDYLLNNFTECFGCTCKESYENYE